MERPHFWTHSTDGFCSQHVQLVRDSITSGNGAPEKSPKGRAQLIRGLFSAVDTNNNGMGSPLGAVVVVV